MPNKVGIIGCGKIFPRHFEAINKNDDYDLVSICDTNPLSLKHASDKTGVTSFKEASNLGPEVNK